MGLNASSIFILLCHDLLNDFLINTVETLKGVKPKSQDMAAHAHAIPPGRWKHESLDFKGTCIC